MSKHNHNLFVAAPIPVAELGAGERLACLRLIRSENVGPVTFCALIKHFGGAEAALAAVPELSRRGGRARPIRLCPVDKAGAELECAQQAGAVPLFTIELGYPAASPLSTRRRRCFTSKSMRLCSTGPSYP